MDDVGTYHQQVATALNAPMPDSVHIPTEVLLKFSPERAASVADNFQFNNIFDNSAARRDLGFQYTILWIKGVKRSITWLEEHNRTPHNKSGKTCKFYALYPLPEGMSITASKSEIRIGSEHFSSIKSPSEILRRAF